MTHFRMSPILRHRTLPDCEPYLWIVKRLLPLVLLFAAAALVARERPLRHPAPVRVLWVGAHPDDEVLVAPLLAAVISPSILVFTRGEAGTCGLPGGCGDDLGAVRSEEMILSAALLHASLTQWSFGDAPGDVDAVWSAEAGSHAELVRLLEGVIAAERPDLICTFDPNHGSTCHAAHLAVGALVAEAAAETRTPVLFLETSAEFLGDGFRFRDADADADAGAFDARPGWHWLVSDAAVHASQFTAAQIAALRDLPPEERQVWLSTSPGPAGCAAAALQTASASRAKMHLRQMKSSGASSAP